MNTQRHNNKDGFTLIETLIAITVMLIAVVAPMSLAQDGITAARLAQDQIVAFYLAQEGVEATRNMRDYNKLNGFDQLTGPLESECEVDPTIPAERGCIIDATEQDGGGQYFATSRCVGACPVIRSNEERYTHSNNAAFSNTKYTREIKVWYVQDPDRKDVKVRVTVTWPFQQGTRSYTLEENLLAW